MRKATLITGSILIAVTIAWLVIRQNYKNIVLMDIQMPVMNGLDATRYIRNELKSAAPVIALTANAIRGENEKCFAAGMNDYLSKPFEESQLIEIISKWIGIKPAIKIKEDAAEVNNKANPMYNLSKLEDIAKGNENFIKKMLQLFVEQVPVCIVEIKQALVVSDLTTIKSLAHRIKPSIDSLGIDCIKEDIRNIELKPTELYATGQLEKLINKLDNVITEVVLDIKKKETPDHETRYQSI